MERLTHLKTEQEWQEFEKQFGKVFREGNYQINDNVMYHNGIDKLGKLEDIEERLGIDLITLFKAMSDGIYYKFNEEIKLVYPICTFDCFIISSYLIRNIFIEYKDYGKTYALTREELEDK